MGVWIETIFVDRGLNIVASHPAWVCGLKQETAKKAAIIRVTPCVGVWIETLVECLI